MSELKDFNRLLLSVSQSNIIDAGEYENAAELICRTACQGLSVSRSSVWQLNSDLTEMRCITLINNNAKEAFDFVLTESDFPAYFEALQEKRFIVADDANAHPDTKEFSETYLRPLGINSMLDAPIRHMGEMVGILCCEHTGTTREWSEPEQSFTAALTDILGRALTAQDRLIAQKELQKTNAQLEAMLKDQSQHLELAHDQIAEQEKMVSLGQLVAGVAHEINTPIGIGVTTASHLTHITKDINESFTNRTITEQQFSDYINNVKEGADLLLTNLNRAAQLIKSFKQIAVDQSDDSFMEVNLAETLANISNSLRPELTKKHRTQVNLDCPNDIYFYTCPGSIAQIITNLLVNAGIHAFEDDQQDRSVYLTGAQDEDNIMIEVKDNGKGIPADIQEKIFDPFVTTRREQGGSGLGLNIVKNLVTEKLKGSVELDSQPNSHTRFIIKLPKQPKP